MGARLETIRSNFLPSTALGRDETRRALRLSTGFWSVYLISHWTGAQVSPLPLSSINFYGFVAIVLVILGLLNYFSRSIIRILESPIDRICSIGMAIAVPMTFCISGSSGNLSLVVIVLIINATCSTWLLVRWSSEYTHVPLEQAFLALIMGAIIVSCLKMAMAVIPKTAMMILMITVPIVSYASLSRTTSDRQQAAVKTPSNHTSNHQPHKVGGSFWLMGTAILIFLFIWSSINMVSKLDSGHYGYGASSSPPLVLLAQAIDIAIVLGLYWWFFIYKHGIDFGQLWRVAFIALAIALTVMQYFGVVPLVQCFTSTAIELALFCFGYLSPHIAITPI